MTTYDELMQIIRGRRSVYTFKDQPVDRADVQRVVEAARWAPSSLNRQGWKFLVYDDRDFIWKLAAEVGVALRHRVAGIPKIKPERLKAIVEYATAFARAPCLVVVLHMPAANVPGELLADVPGSELTSGEPLSAAMAVENLLLAARALQLGTCVMTAPLLVREIFNALPERPPGHEITCLVALGHPLDIPPAPERKGLEHILQFGGGK
jgi:nitroreductase